MDSLEDRNDHRHQCLIYDGPPSRQLPALAAVTMQKLAEGYRCLYLNSISMVAGVRSALAAGGLDVVGAIEKGRLILSSESVLAEDGSFDVDSMIEQLDMALRQALADGYRGLWATGDMTWEFGAEINFGKLLDYEYKLGRLMDDRPELSGICQYHSDTLPLDVPRQALLTHRSIFISPSVSQVNPQFALR